MKKIRTSSRSLTLGLCLNSLMSATARTAKQCHAGMLLLEVADAQVP